MKGHKDRTVKKMGMSREQRLNVATAFAFVTVGASAVGGMLKHPVLFLLTAMSIYALWFIGKVREDPTFHDRFRLGRKGEEE